LPNNDIVDVLGNWARYLADNNCFNPEIPELLARAKNEIESLRKEVADLKDRFENLSKLADEGEL
jgi:ubiquinone biosynthesis protein UbiJ